MSRRRGFRKRPRVASLARLADRESTMTAEEFAHALRSTRPDYQTTLDDLNRKIERFQATDRWDASERFEDARDELIAHPEKYR